MARAGNVTRPETSLRLSMRLPPSADPKAIEALFIKRLTENVPYNAKVSIHAGHTGQGWCMKDPQPWLKEGFDFAGKTFFSGNDVKSYGLGGSIPFLAELGKMYPETGIYAMGVLGPASNAHGPNECINLDYTKRTTCALSHLINCVAEQK